MDTPLLGDVWEGRDRVRRTVKKVGGQSVRFIEGKGSMQREELVSLFLLHHRLVERNGTAVSDAA